MRFCAVALLLLIGTPALAADELSAGQLYQFCTSTDEVAKTACRFYIYGAFQGVVLGDGAIMGADRQMRDRRKSLVCAPENVTQDQMVSIFQFTVRDLLAKYPEDMKLPAVSILVAALNRTFPCPR
jgi:hypothetical protein